MFNRETGVIFVRKINSVGVIGEILKLRKNRYSHIDRGILAGRLDGILELQEVFDDLPALRMLLVK